MIGNYLKERKEKKQSEGMIKLIQGFSLLVTEKCPMDLNKDRKAKKLLNWKPTLNLRDYISGVISKWR